MKGRFKKNLKEIFKNIRVPFETLFTILIIIGFISLILLGPVFGSITIYPGDTDSFQNRLFLLSAIAQSLAAIFALVVSITLVAVQLASHTYTPHVMRLKLKDFFFWLLIAIYLIAILATFLGMGWMQWLNLHKDVDHYFIDICFLLAGTAILFLIPYIYDTINNLKPKGFIKKLLKTHDTQAIEEVLHRAVNEGFITIVDEVGELVDDYTMRELKKANKKKRPAIAKKVADRYFNVAKRAFRKNEQDAFFTIFRHLKNLTKSCKISVFMPEAELFSDTLTELYDFTIEMEGQ